MGLNSIPDSVEEEGPVVRVLHVHELASHGGVLEVGLVDVELHDPLEELQVDLDLAGLGGHEELVLGEVPENVVLDRTGVVRGHQGIVQVEGRAVELVGAELPLLAVGYRHLFMG